MKGLGSQMSNCFLAFARLFNQAVEIALFQQFFFLFQGQVFSFLKTNRINQIDNYIGGSSSSSKKQSQDFFSSL